jgi:hypothetical protein
MPSMTSGSRKSLLYNTAGHRDGGGAAPSKESQMIRMKEEISDYGQSEEEKCSKMSKEEID